MSREAAAIDMTGDEEDASQPSRRLMSIGVPCPAPSPSFEDGFRKWYRGPASPPARGIRGVSGAAPTAIPTTDLGQLGRTPPARGQETPRRLKRPRKSPIASDSSAEEASSQDDGDADNSALTPPTDEDPAAVDPSKVQFSVTSVEIGDTLWLPVSTKFQMCSLYLADPGDIQFVVSDGNDMSRVCLPVGTHVSAVKVLGGLESP